MIRNIYFLCLSAALSALFFYSNVFAAAVEISEIAWMGTQTSAQDEWIELFSDSGASLEGWILETADGGMSIALSGSIAAGGYFLIERTNDDTVPGIAADLVTPFGNGLSNSGEILILRNSSSSEEDKADASGGWPAGDNATKETMQKISGSWQTGAGTPKAPPSNVSEDNPLKSSGPDSSGNQNLSSNSVSSAGARGSSEATKLPKISASIYGQSNGITGAPLYLEGRAFGFSGTEISASRYFWSFGDGSYGEGKSVSHLYRFPGKYYVSLGVDSGEFSASAYREVVISENLVSISGISAEEDSWIKISNGSPDKINISGWIVKNGKAEFAFPKETYILGGATLTLPREISSFSFKGNGAVELLYPSGQIADSYSYGTRVQVVSENRVLSSGISLMTDEKSEPVTENDIAATGLSNSESEIVPETQAGLLAKINLSGKAYSWGLLSLGIGLIAALGLVASRRV